MDLPGVVAARRWSRGRRAAISALLVAATIGAAALADSLFYLRPIAAEKFWIAALRLGVTPLQEEAIFRLRNHPTPGTAVALVAYVRDRSRIAELQLAARATETLCILSGRSFGTEFREQGRSHSWRAPGAQQWPEVLAQIEQWSEQSFGAGR